MAITSSSEICEGNSTYDRVTELKAFDDSKTCVKGLIDSGAAKLPLIFVDEQYEPGEKSASEDCKFTFPTIDFQGIDKDPSLRCEIICKVGNACEKWGCLKVVKHGIPLNLLEEMIDGVRRFWLLQPVFPSRSRSDLGFGKNWAIWTWTTVVDFSHSRLNTNVTCDSIIHGRTTRFLF